MRDSGGLGRRDVNGAGQARVGRLAAVRRRRGGKLVSLVRRACASAVRHGEQARGGSVGRSAVLACGGLGLAPALMARHGGAGACRLWRDAR